MFGGNDPIPALQHVEILFPWGRELNLDAKTLPYCFLERSFLLSVEDAFKINGKFLYPFAVAQEESKVLASLSVT